VFRSSGWVLPKIQTTGGSASIRSKFRPNQGAGSAPPLVGGGLYQSLVEQRCRFRVVLVVSGKMQRVLAVLYDKLPMRKSLRRLRSGRGLRTEDHQHGEPSLTIEVYSSGNPLLDRYQARKSSRRGSIKISGECGAGCVFAAAASRHFRDANGRWLAPGAAR